MLNGLGICSGIGGLERALEPWVRWVACCEREPYPTGVLLGNTGVPIWDDLTTFPWSDFRGVVDIVAAGFPCQDVSLVGRKEGMGGERSILVFQIIEGCRKMECDRIFFENVPNVFNLMGTEILRCLYENGYDARWITLRVPDECPIGEGKRWFLLATSKSFSGNETDTASDSDGAGRETRERDLRSGWEEMASLEWSIPETYLLRKIDGVPFRVDRTKALGNAVVSEQAKEAFKILSGLKERPNGE